MEFIKTVGAIAVLAVAAVFIIISVLLLSGKNKNPEILLGAREIGAGESVGAKVYIDGNLMGVAPVRIKLVPNKAYNIDFRKGEYHLDISDKGTGTQEGMSFLLDLVGISSNKETITFEKPPSKLSDQELLNKVIKELTGSPQKLSDEEKKEVDELIKQVTSGEQLTPRQVANVKKGLAPGPP
jgi:hypothetical protein